MEACQYLGASENRQLAILKDSLIKATDTYKTPPQIIWIDHTTITTLGNFSASTGKAKAKKTFNVSTMGKNYSSTHLSESFTNTFANFAIAR